MRVLYILPQAPDDEARQVEDYVHSLTASMKKRGIEVYTTTEEAEECALALRRTLREIRPHTVQVENRPQLVKTIRQYYDGQLVLNLHSLKYLAGGAIPRRELRVALCLVDKIVLPSHFTKSMFVGRYYGLRLRALVVHRGVDVEKFKPSLGDRALERERAVTRRDWGVGQALTFLFTGGTAPGKGLNVLLKAWPDIHKLTGSVLVLTGNLDGLKLEELGTGIINMPTGETVPEIYRASDLLLYPSQGRESVGRATMEALASGLPVVASFKGGIVEAVTESCGLLVRQYAEPTAWVKAVSDVLSDENRFKGLGLAGRERSLLFSWDRVAARFLQVYSRDGN